MHRLDKIFAIGGFLLGSMLVADNLPAADLLPVERSIAETVDHYIGLKLQAAKIEPTAEATAPNLIRRLTLDLVGRIPTAAEARKYSNSTDADKRNILVDRLIASDAFVRHQANEFDAFLMTGTNASVRDYLLTAFQSRRGWNDMFRDMLIADQTSEFKSAIEFVKRRIRDTDKLANDVSVVFFGVNVSCAKCHDHPLVPDWTQDHFYGMKSFFSRTFQNGDFVGERDYGVVKFRTIAGEERLARPMFLTGRIIDEPEAPKLSAEEKKQEKAELERLKKDKKPPPPPKFSRRAKLAEIALQSPDNEYFSRAIVNRIWYRLFGHGLVMPLDQMHPRNEPSHPLLMEWLARDLVDHDYDLTRLIRGMVMSEVYSRTSLWWADNRPTPDLFAVASVRPLTPYQYASALRLASSSPVRFSDNVSAEVTASRLESLENSARGLAGKFEQPGEDFQVSVTEALLLSNSEAVTNELLRDSGDSLVGVLKKMKDSQTVVETAVWNVLSRAPTDDERKILGDFYTRHGDDRLKASQQLVWSLLTSSELRFNY